MKGMAWAAFVLTVIGVAYYGMGRVVIVGVLASLALAVVGFFAYGIIHELRQPRAPDPLNPSADEFRATKDRDKRARAQARALLEVDVVGVPASDAELAELRRLAGLK